MTYQQQKQYDAAAAELEQDVSEGCITVKQYNQYMRELDVEFAELWEGEY